MVGTSILGSWNGHWWHEFPPFGWIYGWYSTDFARWVVNPHPASKSSLAWQVFTVSGISSRATSLDAWYIVCATHNWALASWRGGAWRAGGWLCSAPLFLFEAPKKPSVDEIWLKYDEWNNIWDNMGCGCLGLGWWDLWSRPVDVLKSHWFMRKKTEVGGSHENQPMWSNGSMINESYTKSATLFLPARQYPLVNVYITMENHHAFNG